MQHWRVSDTHAKHLHNRRLSNESELIVATYVSTVT